MFAILTNRLPSIVGHEKLARCRSFATNTYDRATNPIITKDTRLNKQANVSKVRADGKTIRFYKNVTVVNGTEGYEIELDGYTVLSRKGRKIVLPSEMLAVGVASDWESCHDRVSLRRMYLYNLASLATDLDDSLRDTYEESIISILKSDQLSLRHKDSNSELVELWKQHHDPILEWFNSEFNLHFAVNDEYSPFVQPLHSVRRLQKAVEFLDSFAITGLAALTDSSVSLITALAAWNNVITTKQAVDAFRVESAYFQKIYGDTKGSTDLRLQEQIVEMSAIIFFLRSLSCEPINCAFVKKVLQADEEDKMNAELCGTVPRAKSTRIAYEKFKQKQMIQNMKNLTFK